MLGALGIHMLQMFQGIAKVDSLAIHGSLADQMLRSLMLCGRDWLSQNRYSSRRQCPVATLPVFFQYTHLGGRWWCTLIIISLMFDHLTRSSIYDVCVYPSIQFRKPVVVIDEAVGANSENPIPDLLPDLPPLQSLVMVRTALTAIIMSGSFLLLKLMVTCSCIFREVSVITMATLILS